MIEAILWVALVALIVALVFTIFQMGFHNKELLDGLARQQTELRRRDVAWNRAVHKIARLQRENSGLRVMAGVMQEKRAQA